MPPLGEVTSALDRIDWNFPQTGTTRGSIHTLHRFAGNFIPQIPGSLIQILSRPGDIVLDPFAGSGTTAVEALHLGRHVIASDRISACTFLTAAKISGIRSPVKDRVISELMAILTWDQLCETDQTGLKGEGSDPGLAQWYTPRTLAQLRYLWTVIEQASAPAKATLSLIFSDVLFSCASTAGSRTSTGKIRKHHWGWIADNVIPKSPVEHNAIEIFRSRLLVIRDLSLANVSTKYRALTVQQDARTMALPSESVDLIVTSPPYIAVIDYTRAHRLLYLWMGWPFDEDRTDEIGARYKRGRQHFAEEYTRQISKCWAEFHRVLRPTAYCAIVIGESRPFVGTAKKNLSNLHELMPMVWGPTTRHPTRRRVSGRTAHQSTEFVCVFQKT